MRITEQNQAPNPDYRQLIRQALCELRQARAVGDDDGSLRAECEMNGLLDLLVAPAASSSVAI
jgi:hypothetical protein